MPTDEGRVRLPPSVPVAPHHGWLPGSGGTQFGGEAERCSGEDVRLVQAGVEEGIERTGMEDPAGDRDELHTKPGERGGDRLREEREGPGGNGDGERHPLEQRPFRRRGDRREIDAERGGERGAVGGDPVARSLRGRSEGGEDAALDRDKSAPRLIELLRVGPGGLPEPSRCPDLGRRARQAIGAVAVVVHHPPSGGGDDEGAEVRAVASLVGADEERHESGGSLEGPPPAGNCRQYS